MTTKLTLNINKRTIERAKKLASERKTSLSKMVENYLKVISEDKTEDEIFITPLVKSLIGAAKLPQNFDYKKEYTDYLIKKYK